jgi:hypothetical protein
MEAGRKRASSKACSSLPFVTTVHGFGINQELSSLATPILNKIEGLAMIDPDRFDEPG